MKTLAPRLTDYITDDHASTVHHTLKLETAHREADMFTSRLLEVQAEYLQLRRDLNTAVGERNAARSLARALAATIHEGPKQSIRSTVAARPILAKIRNEDWSKS